MSTLGDALRARATALGLTNGEVARRSGLNERRYGNYVTGRREPDLKTLLRLADVLRTTPDQLLGVSDGAERDNRPERDRLLVTVDQMQPQDVELLAHQAEALLSFRRRRRADR